jgi:hypothetical protein
LVSHWGNTFGQQFFIDRGKQTTNLASINRSVLAQLPIPIAPVEEQTEILREVQRRFSAADRLAAALEQQLIRTGGTRRALRSEAFSGRLVEQDPSDESGTALLDRIRAEESRKEAERTQRGVVSRAAREKEKRKYMKEQAPSTGSLLDAWEKTGGEADAHRLFDEAGYGSDHVVQFYEALRSLPQVRAAFERAAQGQGNVQQHESVKPTKERDLAHSGRFRLIEIWLEDFKNLKDYTVQFDPTQGLDVVLGWNGNRHYHKQSPR